MEEKVKKNTENQEIEIVPANNIDAQLFDFDYVDDSKQTLAYLPALFTTASLPFRNINKTVFVRKGSNGITLKLTSPINVPYGRYGRLLLSVLTTHAVLSKGKNQGPVYLEYATLGDLLKELQLPKSRGTEIKEQLECFSNAAFSFTQKVTELKSSYLFKDLYGENYPEKDVTITTHSTGNIRFTEGVQYKEADDGSGDKKRFAFKIVLSPEFAAFCQSHAVPINYTVYKNILAPIAKDIYAWLVYRNNSIEDSIFIPRHKLVEQFNPVDNAKNNNQENVSYFRIIEYIKEIKEKYYPDLKVDFGVKGEGITLHKSNPPILGKDARYALITTDI